MRIADSITLPPDLERARAADDLVVFAGAGVSMGPPANLPGFQNLARQIGEPRVALGDRTDYDRYLGEAERLGINVQDRARSILSVEGRHTDLHEDLLGIFGTPDRVRLITTNFDPHFSTAAVGVYPGAVIPHYVGPALPPGSRFAGIAHLHGALTNTQDRLVLTDADFAEAYMAEGWAARFLVRVFADRAVLFVGYSVSDPIIQYLLRALPRTDRWFGLWHDSEIPPAGYPIVAVPFSTAANGDKFGDLNDGVRQWHWFAMAPPSDHERKLQNIIATGPPASPIDADYVRARLQDDAGRLVFLTNAKTEAWFSWAADEGLLDCLIDAGGDWNRTAMWARWCIFNFTGGDNPPLLRFVRTRSIGLNAAFLAELRRFICVQDELPPLPILRQLVALVISDPTAEQAIRHDWQWLAEKLIKTGNTTEAFAVLRAATRLRLAPIEALYGAYESDEEGELRSLAVRLRTFAPSAELVDLIDKHGKSIAEFDAEALVQFGEHRIAEAYELLDLAQGASASIDWLSYGRTAIAPSNQDRGAHAEDVLVLLIRTALDYWKVADQDRLRAFAEQHKNSSRTILKRLAIYALAECTTCNADEVLRMAREQRWAQNVWLRPELYRLMAAHYANASEQERSQFIEALRDTSTWGDEFDEHDAHAGFSLSQKLLREAPESDVTRLFGNQELESHPEWAESDPDGYLSRVSVGWGGPDTPSPVDAVEIGRLGPKPALELIASELSKAGDNATRHAILGAFQQAIGSDPNWGAHVVEIALRFDEHGPAIAEAGLWTLREARPSRDAQTKLLNAAVETPLPTRLLHPLSMTAEKWAGDVTKGGDEDLLDALDAVADKLFENARDVRPGIEDRAWTDRAINHPAGHAAQIWWSVANARDWAGDEFQVTIDDAERARWQKVVADDSASGAYARPILGMATDRLSVGDTPWAVAEIFPYFDPARGVERAAQLWDGRLMQSHWSWAAIEALKPYYEPLFAVSESLIPASSRQLGDWVAFLLANRDKSGLTLRKLQVFIQSTTDEGRTSFADALPRQVEQLRPEARLSLWREVLAPYWRDRRTNMPLPLSPQEVREMLSWTLAFPEAADEVLAELRATSVESIEHADDVIWRWKEDDDSWLREHPTQAAGIVAFLAERKSIAPWMTENAVSVLEKAYDAGADKQIALSAAEALVALGSQSAPALAARLRSVP
jgi:hypothetical protein